MRKEAEEIKIRDGESTFIKGTRERGEEINHKNRQDQKAAYQKQQHFLGKKKLQDEEAAQHHAVRSAALLTHCIARVGLSP